MDVRRFCGVFTLLHHHVLNLLEWPWDPMKFETRHSPHTLTTPTSFQKVGRTISVGSMQYVSVATERFVNGSEGETRNR